MLPALNWGFQSPRDELGQVSESQSASKAAGCRKKKGRESEIGETLKRCGGKTAERLHKEVSRHNFILFSMRASFSTCHVA